MGFLEEDGTPSFEPAPDDTALEGGLISVGRDKPTRVPSDERGTCVGATLCELVKQVGKRKLPQARPRGARRGRPATEEEPEGGR